MGTDRIDSLNAKVERAKENISDLESRLETFRASEPYKVNANDNLQSGRRCIVVTEAAPIPFGISTVLGDVLHNLRSTLDPLVYNLWPAPRKLPRNEVESVA
jgi:hypothetical protein